MDRRYTILVRGRLAEHWSGQFGALSVVPNADGTTALTGPIRDQSELHGHLRRIEDLGLTLVSIGEEGGES